MSLRTKRCFIPMCSSTDETKIMLTVPLQKERRARWFAAAGLVPVVSTTLFCCEDHFNLEKDSENWHFYKSMGSKIMLKPHVVPHSNLTTPLKKPRTSQLSDSSKKRKLQLLNHFGEPSSSRTPCLDASPGSSCSIPHGTVHPTSLGRRNKRKQMLFTIPDPDESLNVDIVPDVIEDTIEILAHPLPIPDSTEVDEPMLNADADTTPGDDNIGAILPLAFPSTPDSSTSPTPIRDATPETSPTKTLEDDPLSSTFIPMSSAESLEEVFSTADIGPGSSRAIHLITRDPRFYLGIPTEEFKIIKMASEMSNCSARDVMITIKKIRLKDSNKRLGHDFNLATAYVSKIFLRTVPILSNLFQQLIFWPSASNIKKLLPIPFRHRFSNVQSIIDCFEIQIEKPSKPRNQALTWSEYKKCNTVKILISCTPYGFINFISKAYGGRISDKTIVLKSGYMDVVPAGCDVLADRGFKQIESDLVKKNVTLLRPASVKASMKPSQAEIRESKRIASTRIHIERVISRIREFKLLDIHARIKMKLVPLIDHCIIIAAAVINLQEPIIKL